MGFLPICKEDMEARGWKQLDFIFITGDAYVDHPSFGHAIISRVLESKGYKVGIIAQPDWTNTADFRKLGRPRLGFLIASGNVDSMVNHYSVFKKRRHTDSYSPGGAVGKRPDRAVIVYSSKAREAYKNVPVIIGGIEASLRRFAHYDYWDDKIRRSILLDSKADLLIYGMGEKPIVEIADALDSGIEIKDIRWIRGTVYRTREIEMNEDSVLLPSYEEICLSKKTYAKSFAAQYRNNDAVQGKTLIEKYDQTSYVVQNPPQDPLTKEEMDAVYELPYEGEYHPVYESLGGIPALTEVKFSILSSRGCFGSCSFCALTYHQGKVVQARSKESIVQEAVNLTNKKDFKGYIHDVGGPTANFRFPSCTKQLKSGACMDKDCLFPKPCKNLDIDHEEYLDILRAVRSLNKVKKVFVRSGIRYDYAVYDKDPKFLEELCQHHISGNLKIAPEHISKNVLEKMHKPPKEVFENFSKEYGRINQKLNKKQFLIPYFISSHPGSTLTDAIELAVYLKNHRFVPDQVQDFYPTPGTLSTCMYYTEIDPFTLETVYVPKSMEEKRMQRALLHFNKPENYDLVYKALVKASRKDLIGYGKECLIKPTNKQIKKSYKRK